MEEKVYLCKCLRTSERFKQNVILEVDKGYKSLISD